MQSYWYSPVHCSAWWDHFRLNHSTCSMPFLLHAVQPRKWTIVSPRVIWEMWCHVTSPVTLEGDILSLQVFNFFVCVLNIGLCQVCGSLLRLILYHMHVVALHAIVNSFALFHLWSCNWLLCCCVTSALCPAVIWQCQQYTYVSYSFVQHFWGSHICQKDFMHTSGELWACSHTRPSSSKQSNLLVPNTADALWFER